MASNAAAAVHIQGGPPSASEEEPGRSGREEESGSEEDAAPLPRRMGPEEGRRSADGSTPRQPVGQVPGVGAGRGATRDTLSRLAVGDCAGIIEGWIKRSVSENTWASYNRVWQEWISFVQALGEDPVGQGVSSLLLYYVVQKLDEGVSVSRMNTQLAGLAFLFKLQGQPDVTKEFWVRQALKGYRRAVVKRDSRRPVTFEILRGIVDKLGVVCSSEYEVVLFKVAFVLAFFGAFRIGELVSPSKKVQGGIRLQEVQLDEEGVSIFLRKSKTDQGGRGRMVRIYPIHGSPQCPVGTVREFLKVRPDFQGPLLVHQKGTWLSRFQFVAVFKKCLQGLGLEEKDFSSHSFRIGAATEAARLGLDVEVIKRIGRWESNRFQSYVRPQLAIQL
ncbi:integrase/recombinase xerD homolog [Aquarana catesbeiana]|uniref:integrase/recombinase xerD homolog n=1 Tax=Aquarana catesbeiana TaxID=8400 RepID=UPI003CCA2CA5